MRFSRVLKQEISGSNHPVDRKAAQPSAMIGILQRFCSVQCEDPSAGAENLERLGIAGSRLGALLLKVDFCLPFLLHDELTAIIIPNDSAVDHLRKELGIAGIRVPRDLSLISFDNQIALSGLNTNSIDFGYDNLGYMSFHAILGDIPVRSEKRTGRIAAAPMVIERGSVSAIEIPSAF